MNILYNIIVSEPFCVTVCDTVSCGMIVCNITLTPNCYELKSLELDRRTTLVYE